MMPMQPGIMHPPSPQPPSKAQLALLDKPSWQQVFGLLRDGAHRNYRIDIETDSTIAASLDSDMQGMSQALQGMSTVMGEMMPLVQDGMLPLDAAKELLLAVVRRMRMGMAVEDAIDKMQPPGQKGPDPSIQVAQIKAQGDAQKVQAQAQSDAQAKQMDMQLEQQRMAMEARFEQQRSENDMRVAQAEQAYQAQQDQQAQQMEHAREMQRQANEQQMTQMQAAMDERTAQMQAQMQMMITQLNNAAKIEVAEIAADMTLQSAQISAAKQAEIE